MTMKALAAGAATALALAALADTAEAATATIAPFGTAADGRVVQLVTLKNAHGMTVRFSTRGGTIVDVEAPDRNGRFANMVLGRPSFAEWDKGSGFNSVVGRYANRIDKAGFTLDGKAYTIAGANPKTGVVIHGGPKGFGAQIWAAETFQGKDGAGAVMRYTSADGENGFPGELKVTMTYTLTEDDVLRLDYKATTSKPTVLNLTNHSYWTIGGHAAGPVNDQMLQVFASNVTPTDDRQVPTGEIRPVAGTPFDFRTPVRVGDRIYSADPQYVIGNGLDHNFVLDKAKPGALSVAARLTDGKSGRQLEVRTTEPAVQIYSSNHLIGTMEGDDKRMLRQGDALAFETQHFPDSPNKPNFPTTVLRPGETFHSVTEYAFSTDKTPFR